MEQTVCMNCGKPIFQENGRWVHEGSKRSRATCFDPKYATPKKSDKKPVKKAGN